MTLKRWGRRGGALRVRPFDLSAAATLAAVSGFACAERAAPPARPGVSSLSSSVAVEANREPQRATLDARQAPSAAPPGQRTFLSEDGTVALWHPSALAPSQDFNGRSLMRGGWRTIWAEGDVGPGQGIVRFSLLARPTQGPGDVTELVQVGQSRDPDVLASCKTYGLQSDGTHDLGPKIIGSQTWAVFENRDAGMSQSIRATSYRTVFDGSCYALERITYTTTAASDPSASAPSQAEAAKLIDAVLASVVLRTGRGR